jgi:hypothetical protein
VQQKTKEAAMDIKKVSKVTMKLGKTVKELSSALFNSDKNQSYG